MSNEPTSQRAEILDPPEERNDPASISRLERRRLHSLGYTDTHINRLGAERAHELLATKTPRPGSKAAIKQVAKQVGLSSANAIADHFSDEEIEKRNGEKPKSSGLEIRIDEFTNQCIRGEDPLDAMLLECQQAYPDCVVRLINPDLPRVAGPEFQPIHSTDGKRLEVAGLFAGFMPRKVYDEFYRIPNLERAAKMAGKIKDPKAISENEHDGDLSLTAEQARLAPLQGEGLHIERSHLSRA